jgi:DNA repair exonuclease SbcCD ATPase subunit
MADRSAIEWTEATWNPVTGCSKVSPGCAHCYAETISLRFGRSRKPWLPEHEMENVVLHPERLVQPLRWRRPRLIFVNSMSDLFHERVPFAFVCRIFDVMIEANQHVFQILTKRHERLADLAPLLPWPPNVWIGVSIENRRCVEHRKLANAASKEYRRAVTNAVAKLTRLAAKAEIEVEGAEPAEITAELEQAATDAHGAAVAAEKDVEGLQKRLIERQKLEQEIVDDRHLCALHQALARELRTDHFIAFVLQESMNQLAAQASDQLLRISDGRYSLIADEGSFEVVDHHNADERRSVATLSGGETFLASLSLALALSAGLRELAGTAAGRLEAIFIDEGFGALDPETLDVVVDALERLREGDRMVGVITHVPTLAERIPSGLSVEKNGNSSHILVR